MDYFSLVKSHPKLFSNENALLNIVLDPKIISDWEVKKESELIDRQLSLEWAKIGVVLDDQYNIIVRDLVLFPDGDMRGYGRSIATASLRGGKGVVVLPEYKGKIMLLHQYRHPTRQWHYEVPRGYGEPNIPAAKNAHKEIEEETSGKVEELVSLGELFNNTGYESASVALFYAKLASVGAPEVNEGIESFVWLTVKELEEWIASEKITDGFTIAAYTKAKLKGLI
jgi:ADP-ribose pyrophosphatase